MSVARGLPLRKLRGVALAAISRRQRLLQLAPAVGRIALRGKRQPPIAACIDSTVRYLCDGDNSHRSGNNRRHDYRRNHSFERFHNERTLLPVCARRRLTLPAVYICCKLTTANVKQRERRWDIVADVRTSPMALGIVSCNQSLILHCLPAPFALRSDSVSR